MKISKIISAVLFLTFGFALNSNAQVVWTGRIVATGTISGFQFDMNEREISHVYIQITDDDSNTGTISFSGAHLSAGMALTHLMGQTVNIMKAGNDIKVFTFPEQ